jgi:hypothetical protein
VTDRGDQLKALLLGFELELMDPAIRKDRARVSALLAEDFREFGSSGRVWSREEILELLATESAQAAPVVEGFEINGLAEGAALVTYRAVHPHQTSLRSSLWVRREGRWKMVFHQGTKVRML